MLRIMMKNHSSWRSLYLAANRWSKTEPKITILNSPSKNSLSLNETPLDKIHLAPPVHSTPFAELNDNGDQSDGTPSDIAEFVDNLGPPLPISFNLAAYVNHSESLQNLVRLGVDLSEIEKTPDKAKFILTLDFEKHIKKYIQFLHDLGVSADNMGKLITKNPFIFKESIENLEIRINYLRSKNFSHDAITHIVTSNPYFLSLETIQVDSRLGFFQKQFSLSGHEVRYLVTKQPKLVTYQFVKFTEKMFVIKEELGYSNDEMKKLLLMKPKVFMLGNKVLRERFDIVHNLMKISHEKILQFPSVFLTRGFRLKQRHLYLVQLNRAQYDPMQPLYVSLEDITTLTDSAFCEKCAKTSVEQYNEFLMTL